MNSAGSSTVILGYEFYCCCEIGKMVTNKVPIAILFSNYIFYLNVYNIKTAVHGKMFNF